MLVCQFKHCPGPNEATLKKIYSKERLVWQCGCMNAYNWENCGGGAPVKNQVKAR